MRNLLFLAMFATTLAAHDDRYEDRRRGGEYGRGGGVYSDDDYGYENRGRMRDRQRRGSRGSSASAVERTLRDLERLDRRAFTDGHERKHVEKAREELFKFQERWRDGKFDSSRLDKAIDNLEHLSRAQQLHPGDRQMIAQDIQALQQFRSSGGRYRDSGGVFGGWGR